MARQYTNTQEPAQAPQPAPAPAPAPKEPNPGGTPQAPVEDPTAAPGNNELSATEEEAKWLEENDEPETPVHVQRNPNYRLSPAEKQFLKEFGDVVAAPLVNGNFLDLKPKNPANIFRWINRVSQDGLRFEQMKFAGFVIAKPEDVKGYVPEHLIRDGKLIVGDVICMMISKAKYYGALKHNHMMASRAARRGVVDEGLVNEVQQQAVPIGAPPELKRKIRAYTPDSKELQKVFGDK